MSALTWVEDSAVDGVVVIGTDLPHACYALWKFEYEVDDVTLGSPRTLDDPGDDDYVSSRLTPVSAITMYDEDGRVLAEWHTVVARIPSTRALLTKIWERLDEEAVEEHKTGLEEMEPRWYFE
jgi:hypothetical protein